MLSCCIHSYRRDQEYSIGESVQHTMVVVKTSVSRFDVTTRLLLGRVAYMKVYGNSIILFVTGPSSMSSCRWNARTSTSRRSVSSGRQDLGRVNRSPYFPGDVFGISFAAVGGNRPSDAPASPSCLSSSKRML